MYTVAYIYTIQKGILPLLNIEPNIHILDCTDLEVNFKNSNYEMSGISHVVLYAGYEFGVLTLFELMEFYAHSPKNVQKLFENILK